MLKPIYITKEPVTSKSEFNKALMNSNSFLDLLSALNNYLLAESKPSK